MYKRITLESISKDDVEFEIDLDIEFDHVDYGTVEVNCVELINGMELTKPFIDRHKEEINQLLMKELESDSKEIKETK